MKLSDLVKAIKPLSVGHGGADTDVDPRIASVHYRSQDVKPGGLFVAIAGHTADGHDFIEDAIERGAAAIVSQKQIGCQIPHVRVADSRRALADIAACFYGNPSEHLTVIGITGTNGKTTTSEILGSMLMHSGFNVFVGGNIGNPLIGYVDAEQKADFIVTEISSFQLDTIDTFRPRISVLLNITVDHLDRYPSFDAYAASKLRIFKNQQPNDLAVLNGSNPLVRSLTAPLKITKLYYASLNS